MDYFELLNLEREPFSNSPDPDYLFLSRQHHHCLQKLELSIRLRRGLNVVIGRVGTGKTTLCRQLIRRFSETEGIETHLLLDPHAGNAVKFLQAIAARIAGERDAAADSETLLKEAIKRTLFEKGVDAGRTVVLIIDEGQKMPGFGLERLRELLNYETNTFKLLQIVIFAQEEFEATLAAHANVADRISTVYRLGPLGFRDTRSMIAFRLKRAGYRGSRPLFTPAGILAVFQASGGYPRRIVNLCHQCVLALIIQDRHRIGWRLVRASRLRLADAAAPRRRRLSRPVTVVAALAVAAAVAILGFDRRLDHRLVSALSGAVSSHRVSNAATRPGAVHSASAVSAGPVSHRPASEPAIAAVFPVDRRPGAPPPARPDAKARMVASAAPAGTPGPAPVNEDPAAPPVATPLPATAAEIAPTPAPATGTPPDSLGRVRLGAKETLSWLMIKVYGRYSVDDLHRVMAWNPDLGRPKALFPGTPIRFPASAIRLRRRHQVNWWVVLASVKSLGDALDVVRRYPAARTPVRIVALWEADRGLSFRVLLWTRYRDKARAAAAMAALPPVIARDARLVSSWPEGALYYANPYRGSLE